jgi:Concanavalin A-like lectin/glucanases superfamily
MQTRRPILTRLNPAWARDLFLAYPFTGYGPAATDLSVTRANGTLGGDASWGRGEFGSHVTLGGTNSHVVPPNTVTLTGRLIFTIAFLARANSLSGGGASLRYVGSQESPTGAAWALRLNTSSQIIEWVGNGLSSVTGPAPALGAWVLYTLRYSASATDLFYDARRVGTVAHGAVGPVALGDYWVGSAFAFNDRAWSGAMAAHYAWGRTLSDQEIITLAADPFSPFRPESSSLSVLALGAGVTLPDGGGGGGEDEVVTRSEGALIGTNESTGVSLNTGATISGTEKDLLGDNASRGTLSLYLAFTPAPADPECGLDIRVYRRRITSVSYEVPAATYRVYPTSTAAQRIYLGEIDASRYMIAEVSAGRSSGKPDSSITNVSLLYELEKIS